MAESLATDDHQQAGSSSSASASSSANTSTPSPLSQPKPPIPNTTTSPPQPQSNGSAEETPPSSGIPVESPRENGMPTNGTTKDNSSKPTSKVSEANLDLVEETDPPAPVESEAKDEEAQEPRNASKKKPGPSSDITAAEWDGGMAKEDVQDIFEDLENADSDGEPLEEKPARPPKVDKGKSPLLLAPKHSNGKSRASSPESRKDNNKTLRLIDLPLDVLKDIVREVTNTTDLCSLCLVHSSLHALAIPLIYSRFDIVWPDQNITSDRTGVDALTYGLATLVSNENEYAQYVRKFSLGNGPKEWVSEYATNKEGGKMLGTLVSLAVWKMEMLETFSWDMPTGILRDVWRALHRQKTLRNIHVRWHDNNSLNDITGSQDGARKIEYPTFSGFKDLKSLSVLDLDELSYLREMAATVDKSYNTLRELRMGISASAQGKRWVHDDVETITPDSVDGIGEGGAIGILVGKICDFNKRASATPILTTSQEATASSALTQEQLAQILQGQQQAQQGSSTDTDAAAPASGANATSTGASTTAVPAPPSKISKPKKSSSIVSKQLRLEILELERVPISTRVITKAIDFSSLVSLTLLNCGSQSKLFKTLKRKYPPYPANVLAKLSKLSLGSNSHTQNKQSFHIPAPNYRLRLRKIHTDMVSNSLIEFLHQTLAPNSLETLFLQEAANDNYISAVELSQIVTEVLRRHRLSLQRLLIDSFVQHDIAIDPQLTPVAITDRKKKWSFDKETISFITEMPRLREVAFGISFEDWHFLLTRLPDIRSLRSLYVPHVVGSVDYLKSEKQSDALAMMIVDVVTLRPECGLCYVGIVNKCFELLEGDEILSNGDPEIGVGETNVGTDDDDDDEASDDDDGTNDGNEEDASDDGNETDDGDDAGSDSPASPSGNSTSLSPFSPFSPGILEEEEVISIPRKRPGIRYREILFYDDKVAVFKARHAKL